MTRLRGRALPFMALLTLAWGCDEPPKAETDADLVGLWIPKSFDPVKYEQAVKDVRSGNAAQNGRQSALPYRFALRFDPDGRGRVVEWSRESGWKGFGLRSSWKVKGGTLLLKVREEGTWYDYAPTYRLEGGLLTVEPAPMSQDRIVFELDKSFLRKGGL